MFIENGNKTFFGITDFVNNKNEIKNFAEHLLKCRKNAESKNAKRTYFFFCLKC